jgi:hypothetical protein
MCHSISPPKSILILCSRQSAYVNSLTYGTAQERKSEKSYAKSQMTKSFNRGWSSTDKTEKYGAAETGTNCYTV